MNRRSFFTKLASGIIVATSSQIFLPKLIKPVWKRLQLSDIGITDEQFLAYANFIAPFIRSVMVKGNTLSTIYQDFPLSDLQAPSFPTELYYGPYLKRDGVIIN